jgi:hypothetical protein
MTIRIGSFHPHLASRELWAAFDRKRLVIAREYCR